MSSSQKFQPTSKSEPCPICGNISGFCKSREGDRGDLLIYCHNEPVRPSGPINGHHWTSVAGEWGVFSTEKPKNQGSESTRTKAPNRTPQPLPSPADRDATFRSYMDNLTLNSDDRADLNRRGVSDEQIASWGVLSIEGKEPGYLCPCYSPNGAIVGAQWRLRNVVEGARYKWVWWLGGGSKNGEELPLTVHRPIGVEPVGIAVCEGIGAKSFILAQNTGMVTIGAGVAGQFISSPDHWREYLAALTDELNTKALTFYPDAGSVKNESVMGHYSQWLRVVVDLGYTVEVAWWGQSVKGESPDPDELTADVDVKLISVEEFEAIAKPVKEIPWKCLSSHLDQVGAWKTEDLGKNSFEMAKVAELIEEMKVNPNIKYMGTRTAQPNGSQDAHELHTFSVFEPQLNLDFSITKMIASPNGGLLELKTTQRQGDRLVAQLALIKSTDTTKVDGFINALKQALGRNIVCNLKPNSLQALIQNRTAMYQISGGRTYRLADRVGQQDDGFWVFEDTQFKPGGLRTTEEESGLMFNRSLGEEENIPSPVIAPQNPEAIKNLVIALKAFYSPEAMPYVLLTLGFAVMGLHRQELMKHVGEVASLAIYGEKGGGKSAAQRAAASLYGLHDYTLSDFSVSMFGELTKSLGSLPIQVDDPIRQGSYAKSDEEKINSALWKLHGGLGRAVRGNTQSPNTVICVSTNRTLGQGNAAIASRLISFVFPVCPINRSAGTAMSKALKGASGGLSQILAIPCDIQSIEASGNQLLEHLAEADSRNANSLATLGYFTQKFCELAEVEFDALTFIKTEICPQTNEQGAGKDSLTDFLEKLAILKSEGTVGDWSLGEVKKRDGSKYLAVQLDSIWDSFEARFKPNYSIPLIKQMAEKDGGERNYNANFVASRDTAIAFQKALDAWEMGTAGSHAPIPPKRDRQVRSLLIPRSVAQKAGFFPTEPRPEPIAEPTPEPSPEPIAVPTPEPEPTESVAVDHVLWDEDAIEAVRRTIQNDPTAVSKLKKEVPRSQWPQVGIGVDGRYAA